MHVKVMKRYFLIALLFFTSLPNIVLADGFVFSMPYKIQGLSPDINRVHLICKVTNFNRKVELAREDTYIKIGNTQKHILKGNATLIFDVAPSKKKYMRKPMRYDCSIWLCRGTLCKVPAPRSWTQVHPKSLWKQTGELAPLAKR